MSSKEKLIKRFRLLPSDFTFDELERLLGFLGYEKSNKGKTSGSRVIYKDASGHPIMIHRPHPDNTIKGYAMRQILDELTKKSKI